MLTLTISAGNMYPDGTADDGEDVLVNIDANQCRIIGEALVTRVREAVANGEADVLDVSVTWNEDGKVELSWCEACADDPAGQRWLCPNRPHRTA